MPKRVLLVVCFLLLVGFITNEVLKETFDVVVPRDITSFHRQERNADSPPIDYLV
jgi:hypothetical protein